MQASQVSRINRSRRITQDCKEKGICFYCKKKQS